MNAPPTLPESAPFSPPQRAWLIGYIASLFWGGSSSPTADPGAAVAVDKRALTIFFRTQTGRTKTLAKRFARAFSRGAFKATAVAMTDFASVDLTSLQDLLVITSTHGAGEMPENAHAF